MHAPSSKLNYLQQDNWRPYDSKAELLSKVCRRRHVANARLPDGPRPVLREIGINKASTFTGFCGRHDNEAFLPLAKEPMEVSHETVSLLTYRSVCHELFLKRCLKEFAPFQRYSAIGRDVSEKLRIERSCDYFEAGVLTAIRELSATKAYLDANILSKSYSGVSFYALSLDRFPGFSCSGVSQPEHDFHGNVLQDVSTLSLPSDWVACNSIVSGDSGLIILS